MVEDPRGCSYLPGRTASLEYRIVERLNVAEYEDLLARGYRRFGRQLFRPECPDCKECVSIRVLVGEFSPSRSQRRVLRSNSRIRAVRDRVYLSDAHVALYNRYHRFMGEHRGWRHDPITRAEYYESFVYGGGKFAWQWLFFDGGDLVGVALMDEALESISMVYYFHDPAWRPESPGTFAILKQLDYARERGLRYAYPGYWIPANPSMAYKSRFRPFEALISHPGENEQPRWMLWEGESSAAQVPPRAARSFQEPLVSSTTSSSI